MERSRSKRWYYDQDYDSETLHSRTKPRYSGGGVGGGQQYVSGDHRRSVGRGVAVAEGKCMTLLW